MSIQLLSRRHFLTLALLALGGRLAPALGAVQERRDAFSAAVGLMYNLVTLRVTGTIREVVDRGAGRYAVEIQGDGEGVANHLECVGILRRDRWAPVRTATWVQVQGRQNRTQATYDHHRGVVEYRARGETFLLRRRRVVDDQVTVPPGVWVDDVVSAALNYLDGFWPVDPDGALRTHVVGRLRSQGEGPETASPASRAGLVPLELRMTVDEGTGQAVGLLDLSPLSSWALEDEPARVIFGPGRRLVAVNSSMILGTSLAIRLGEV